MIGDGVRRRRRAAAGPARGAAGSPQQEQPAAAGAAEPQQEAADAGAGRAGPATRAAGTRSSSRHPPQQAAPSPPSSRPRAPAAGRAEQPAPATPQERHSGGDGGSTATSRRWSASSPPSTASTCRRCRAPASADASASRTCSRPRPAGQEAAAARPPAAAAGRSGAARPPATAGRRVAAARHDREDVAGCARSSPRAWSSRCRSPRSSPPSSRSTSPRSPGCAHRAKADFEAREGVKLSFLPFFAKAAVEALKAHPKLNASIDPEKGEVTYHDAEHLGIAVDTERGLLVPVINDAGDLNIAGLARKIADLAERTRTNKITPDELGGGTFTLTNTGSRGALFDTPIINQPQVGILGTGAVVKRPVVVDDPRPRRDDRGPLDGLPRADLRPPPGRRRRRRPLPHHGQGSASRRARSRPTSASEPKRPREDRRHRASGLIGTALVASLREDGHDVVRLVRGHPGTPTSALGPRGRTVDAGRARRGSTSVVHLAGAGVADKRWTRRTGGRAGQPGRRHHDGRPCDGRRSASRRCCPRRDRLLRRTGDRVRTSRTRRGRLTRRGRRPGRRATAPAEGRCPGRADAHRGGLSPAGGASPRLLPIFRLGLGGRLGSGEQWWSWISLADYVRAVRFLADREDTGRSREPQRAGAADHAEMTAAMGRVLHPPTSCRRARLRPEAPVARLRGGPAAASGSCRVTPGRREFTLRAHRPSSCTLWGGQPPRIDPRATLLSSHISVYLRLQGDLPDRPPPRPAPLLHHGGSCASNQPMVAQARRRPASSAWWWPSVPQDTPAPERRRAGACWALNLAVARGRRSAAVIAARAPVRELYVTVRRADGEAGDEAAARDGVLSWSRVRSPRRLRLRPDGATGLPSRRKARPAARAAAAAHARAGGRGDVGPGAAGSARPAPGDAGHHGDRGPPAGPARARPAPRARPAAAAAAAPATHPSGHPRPTPVVRGDRPAAGGTSTRGGAVGSGAARGCGGRAADLMGRRRGNRRHRTRPASGPRTTRRRHPARRSRTGSAGAAVEDGARRAPRHAGRSAASGASARSSASVRSCGATRRVACSRSARARRTAGEPVSAATQVAASPCTSLAVPGASVPPARTAGSRKPPVPGRSRSAGEPSSRAMPRSPSSGRPSAANSTFAGVTSPCTSPRAWTVGQRLRQRHRDRHDLARRTGGPRRRDQPGQAAAGRRGRGPAPRSSPPPRRRPAAARRAGASTPARTAASRRSRSRAAEAGARPQPLERDRHARRPARGPATPRRRSRSRAARRRRSPARCSSVTPSSLPDSHRHPQPPALSTAPQ